jgi:methionyl aminopeptidase
VTKVGVIILPIWGKIMDRREEFMFRKRREQALGIELKTKEDIAQLRIAGRLVAEAFDILGEAIHPGVKLSELDKLAADFIEKNNAQAIYKGYRLYPDQPPFPGVITASVNDQICHGLPNGRVLKEGDIVGIDIGLSYQGWCGDACITYPVGNITSAVQRLLDITKESLNMGIRAAQPGNHLSDIGAAIQNFAERQGYSVVRDWGGHGVGRNLHEAPHVPHIGPGGRGPRLRAGMVIAIEPMINIGRPDYKLLDDHWTVVTADGSLSAQYEHTIAITEEGPVILSVK